MKILVVDDELDVKPLFEQRFRKEIKNEEMSFAFAFCGKDALTYLTEHEHEAVLVLSDINMPGMSGLQLLENIKTRYYKPSPTVMMMTAYSDEQSYTIAKSLGADDFLTKPLDFALLKQKLKPIN